jgi:hypothetical protein
MAILNSLPGLEVFVCIDGEPLEEYNDNEEEEVEETLVAEHQAASTVSKYVESASDKEFYINIVLGTSFKMDCETLMAPIKIDGKFIIETVFVRKSFPNSIQGPRILSTISRNVQGVVVPAPGNQEQDLVQKFKFTKIDTSELLLPISTVIIG